MKGRILCLNALVSLIFPFIAGAQNSVSTPDTPLLIVAPWKQEVVVSGTRTEKTTLELPLPTLVIPAERIRQSGNLRLGDLLSEQSGLVVLPGFGAGLQIQGLSAEYNLIMLDGEPLVGRTAGVLDLNRIPLVQLKQVEVVKGPSSSLYGSDALGGVVNMVTRFDSSAGQHLNLSIRGGSFKLRDLRMEAGLGRSRWSWQGWINPYSAEQFSLRPFSQSPVVGPILRMSQQQQWSYRPGRGHEFVVLLRTQFDTARNEVSVTTGSGASVTTGREQNREYLGRLDWHHRIGQHYNGRLRLYATRYRNEQSLGNEQGLIYTDGFDQQYLKSECQGIWNPSTATQWVYGAGAVRDAVQSARYDAVGLERVNPIFYLFNQFEHRFPKQLTLLAALRYDRHQLYASAWSPKLALQGWISPQQSWKFSVSRGFKIPDFRQLYLNFINPAAGNYRVFGSLRAREGVEALQAAGQISALLDDYGLLSELQPEFSTAFQAGTVRFFDLARHWQAQWESDLFVHRLKNMIDSRPIAVQTDGAQIFSYLNVNRAITAGWENRLRVYHRKISISVGGQYLWCGRPDDLKRIRDGLVYTRKDGGNSRLLTTRDYRGLPFRSTWQGQLVITYTPKPNDFFIRWQSTYRSSWITADTDGNGLFNQQDLSAPALLSCRIGVGGSWKNEQTSDKPLAWEWQAGIDNLLNYQNAYFLPNLMPRNAFILVKYHLFQ
jgi:outer membrane receptor for ferrienterochelin and colicins